MRVTIGIPTRDRPAALGRLLASITAQSYKDWDLHIYNDCSGDMLDAAGELILEGIKQHHDLVITEGARINQAYGHNAVLWSPHSADLILRLDDDVRLSPDYIEVLVRNWTKLLEDGVNAGAVSGIFFTEHIRPRDDHPPVPTAAHQSVSVGPVGQVSPNAFMQEYSDDGLIKCQHLYSSCLYSRDAMRSVGGWPLNYSVGCSYHEETDGTFRLHLAGYKLFLVPAAKAVHSHEAAGGTRLMSPSRHAECRASDLQKLGYKAMALRSINYRPRVAVYSDHCTRLGGGKRLTYSLLDDALAEMGVLLSSVSFYACDDAVDAVRGANLPHPYQGDFLPRKISEAEGVYDILVTVGHTPPPKDQLPPHIKHIHYSMYPVTAHGVPHHVDRFVAISEFSAQGVRAVWHRDAEFVYPCVPDPGIEPRDVTKERLILIVGRPSKGVWAMMDAWALLVERKRKQAPRLAIVTPRAEEKMQAWIDAVGEGFKDKIEYHHAISDQELADLYSRASVLWAGRGFGIENPNFATSLEHFGYTPAEAMSYYCLPIAYDAGGYQETTLLRWRTLEELVRITEDVLADRELWQRHLAENLEHLPKFSEEQFRRNWLRIITSTNALAWDKVCEWRAHRALGRVEVVDDSVHVACMVDHPGLNTGYGVIARETLKGLNEAGFKCHVFGINGHRPDLDGEYASLWPAPRKFNNKEALRDFLRHRRFDVAFIGYDPIITQMWITSIRAATQKTYRLPIVTYTSQESLPLNPSWEKILAESAVPLVYCKAAADAIMKRYGREVDYVYLGADHAPFRRYSEIDRTALRSGLGWNDRFIILCVATNKRHKRLQAMIKTTEILRDEYGHDDVLLLLHTTKDSGAMHHGVNVMKYAEGRGIEDLVAISATNAGGCDYEADLEEILRSAPGDVPGRAEWFRSLGMIERYNLANMYLDMSGAEGWGLPVFEAMACGVPTISVDDGYVRSEVLGEYVPRVLPTMDDGWLGGADMVLADPERVARHINDFMGSDLRTTSDGVMAHAAKFSWDAVRAKVVEAIKQCLI